MITLYNFISWESLFILLNITLLYSSSTHYVVKDSRKLAQLVIFVPKFSWIKDIILLCSEFIYWAYTLTTDYVLRFISLLIYDKTKSVCHLILWFLNVECLNMNMILKRIILFRKFNFLLIKILKAARNITKDFYRFRETVRNWNFVLLLHGGHIDIWPYFRDLMHYLSNPILTARAKFSGENQNSPALYYTAPHSPDYIALLSLYFSSSMEDFTYLLRNS